MRGKSPTCRHTASFLSGSSTLLAVADRKMEIFVFRQVKDLPRIGVAEPLPSNLFFAATIKMEVARPDGRAAETVHFFTTSEMIAEKTAPKIANPIEIPRNALT